MATTKKTPAATFRHGTVKAAVWENTGKDGTFYNVTFTNSFKNAEGKWKNINSYSAFDLEDNLFRALFQAKLWIMKNKS